MHTISILARSLNFFPTWFLLSIQDFIWKVLVGIPLAFRGGLQHKSSPKFGLKLILYFAKILSLSFSLWVCVCVYLYVCVCIIYTAFHLYYITYNIYIHGDKSHFYKGGQCNFKLMIINGRLHYDIIFWFISTFCFTKQNL